MSLYKIIKTGKGKHVLFKLSRYVNIFSTRSSFIFEFNVQNKKSKTNVASADGLVL